MKMEKKIKGILVASLIPILAILQGLVFVAPALAASAPPNTMSRYVSDLTNSSTNDWNTMYSHGCTDAQNDPYKGNQVEVILDFASQGYNGSTSGTYLWNGTWLPDSEIQWAAEAYAAGWYNCGVASNAYVTIAVGTNSSPVYAVPSKSLGFAWANDVIGLKNYLSNHGYNWLENASGGDDMETEWGNPSAVQSWADGYQSNADYTTYNDYGDAGGCSSTSWSNSSCNGGWNQQNVWYVSWHEPAAVPFPEIYNTYGTNANQWEMVSLYGNYYQGGAVYPYGSLTQSEACAQKGGCNGTNNTPSAGWTQLYNALNYCNASYTSNYCSTIGVPYPPPSAGTPPFSSDMEWDS